MPRFSNPQKKLEHKRLLLAIVTAILCICFLPTFLTACGQSASEEAAQEEQVESVEQEMPADEENEESGETGAPQESAFRWREVYENSQTMVEVSDVQPTEWGLFITLESVDDGTLDGTFKSVSINGESYELGYPVSTYPVVDGKPSDIASYTYHIEGYGTTYTFCLTDFNTPAEDMEEVVFTLDERVQETLADEPFDETWEDVQLTIVRQAALRHSANIRPR